MPMDDFQKAVLDQLKVIGNRLDSMDGRFDGIDSRLDRLESQQSALHERQSQNIKLTRQLKLYTESGFSTVMDMIEELQSTKADKIAK